MLEGPRIQDPRIEDRASTIASSTLGVNTFKTLAQKLETLGDFLEAFARPGRSARPRSARARCSTALSGLLGGLAQDSELSTSLFSAFVTASSL